MKPYNELVQAYKFIEFDDLCELVGLTFSQGIRQFTFACNSPNDSYAVIDCSDYGYQDKCEDLAYHEDYPHHNSESLISKIKNDIKLIEILRNQYGIRDTVLTYISW